MSEPPEVTPGPHVVAAWRGGYAATVSSRQHELTVDEPAEAGGADTGPMPTELLCGALASCFCLALAHVAGKRELVLDGLEVTVDAERLGREQRYGRLTVTVAARVEHEVLAATVERAKPFCWVSNMLDPAIEVAYVPTVVHAHPPK